MYKAIIQSLSDAAERLCGHMAWMLHHIKYLTLLLRIINLEIDKNVCCLGLGLIYTMSPILAVFQKTS